MRDACTAFSEIVISDRRPTWTHPPLIIHPNSASQDTNVPFLFHIASSCTLFLYIIMHYFSDSITKIYGPFYLV